jgi:hypothetical protein
MIEEGLVKLLNGNSAVIALSPVGGFPGILPKDMALPSWAYTIVSDPENYTLKGTSGLGKVTVQIDIFGSSAADCINLGKAINAVLSGYAGILSDPDSTRIDSAFRSNKIDFFDSASRTYRRMLEYEIWTYR